MKRILNETLVHAQAAVVIHPCNPKVGDRVELALWVVELSTPVS